MMSAVVLVIFASLAIYASGQTPSPPTVFPLTWHTWVVTTVKDAASKYPTFNEGRLVMFDSNNQVACRYWEQNLINQTTTRRADYCDYKAQLHYTMNDTKPNSNCSNVTKASDTISRLVYPKDFVSSARFLGVDNVSQYQCNHFYAPAIKVGDAYVQIDVWVDVTRGTPCQVSTLDLRSQEIINWAFDGFDINIPHQAIQQCSIPKIMCSQENWVCQANRTASQDALIGALGWVCGQGGLDCSPINPGGSNFYPDTVMAHCDWAFNTYYRSHRYNQGIDACSFNGLASLVPPTPTPPPPTQERQDKPQYVDRDIISFLRGMAFVAAFPLDLICINDY